MEVTKAIRNAVSYNGFLLLCACAVIHRICVKHMRVDGPTYVFYGKLHFRDKALLYKLRVWSVLMRERLYRQERVDSP